MFACCGILFNHESPRRGETFVTRKIARSVAHIKYGLEQKLYLGNLSARRDWGYAPEYVRAMWLMLQQEKPGDYVIGTGENHTVEEFVQKAFAHASMDWKEYTIIDPRYYRPTEVDNLLANKTKAHTELNWAPTTDFNRLITIMVDSECQAIARPLNSSAISASRSRL
jgi:GDPmannose 4,6-dehydratase